MNMINECICPDLQIEISSLIKPDDDLAYTMITRSINGIINNPYFYVKKYMNGFNYTSLYNLLLDAIKLDCISIFYWIFNQNITFNLQQLCELYRKAIGQNRYVHQQWIFDNYINDKWNSIDKYHKLNFVKTGVDSLNRSACATIIDNTTDEIEKLYIIEKMYNYTVKKRARYSENIQSWLIKKYNYKPNLIVKIKDSLMMNWMNTVHLM